MNGQALKRMRKHLKVSQVDLSAGIISRNQLSAIENNISSSTKFNYFRLLARLALYSYFEDSNNITSWIKENGLCNYFNCDYQGALIISDYLSVKDEINNTPEYIVMKLLKAIHDGLNDFSYNIDCYAFMLAKSTCDIGQFSLLIDYLKAGSPILHSNIRSKITCECIKYYRFAEEVMR